MFILLSSAAAPRYRFDILRCVSAPIDGHVQFRYALRHCSDDALDQLRAIAATSASQLGLVCFANNAVASGPLEITPIRIVLIESVAFHGNTLSMGLRMGEFVACETDTFTRDLQNASNGQAPSKIEGAVTGRFCFLAEEQRLLAAAIRGRAIAVWEKMVEMLQNSVAFENELFFWAVLGRTAPTNVARAEESFEPWHESLPSACTQVLKIYHYRPRRDGEPTGHLDVSAGGPVEAASPSLIEVDSRYDLKRWLFSTPHKDSRPHFGWLSVRTNNEWSLDLPVLLHRSTWGIWLASLVAGTFIALPPITSYVTAHLAELNVSIGGMPHAGFWFTTVLSLLSGWIAAAVVLAGLPRVRP